MNYIDEAMANEREWLERKKVLEKDTWKIFWLLVLDLGLIINVIRLLI